MEYPDFKGEFAYPYDLYHHLARFPLQHVIPCSVLYDNDIKGGLLLTSPTADLKFFNINPPNFPEPNFKFRMLNIFEKAYAIEIHLIFTKDRLLKIHLDPTALQTIEFLKLCYETKMISFHYYCKSTNFFSSSITWLDDEHVQWFERNYKLAKNLSQQNDYLSICKALFYEMLRGERLYHYFENEMLDCFIREGSVIVKAIQ